MKKAILLAAYGASTSHGRFGLSSFESLCRNSFGKIPVRWAFTSPLLRERLARDKQKTDSVAKALFRLHFEKHRAVAIQPLQTIPGKEYELLLEAVDSVRHQTGLSCAVGKPLLAAGPKRVARALLEHLPANRKHDEDLIFMGHGAKHKAEALYEELSDEISRVDKHIFIGTMSGSLSLNGILPELTSKTVWLMPLLSCIGQHAIRDMAGGDSQSWKSQIDAAGHICVPVLSGMVESSSIAAIWLEHLETTIRNLDN